MSQLSESSSLPEVNPPAVFWDTYEKEGLREALIYLSDAFDTNAIAVELALPFIMSEAKGRGISAVQFLQEFEHAIRTNNDGGGIPTERDHEDDQHQDEDGASQARDADGEDQERGEETAPGEDV